MIANTSFGHVRRVQHSQIVRIGNIHVSNNSKFSYAMLDNKNLHSLAYTRYIRKQQEDRRDKGQLPKSIAEISNETIISMSEMGSLPAKEELLKREIILVDGVSREEAEKKFKEVEAKNLELRFLFSLPYRIGITAAVTAAAASFPLVFHYDIVSWFNDAYVTADVPEPKDLETWLEVGSWSWNWMEPVMGQISFVLLCLQYARAQFVNLGKKPYTAKLLEYRANRLVKAFPHYHVRFLKEYSKATPL